jgi:23S rRNA G2445 N2-methylase RlmL
LVKYPSLIGAAPFKEMLGRFHGNAYTVNASITGKHNYSRFEAAAAFGAALETVYDMKPGNANERGTEFRLDIINEHLLIFVKLTDAAFRYRGKERISQQGALRPTVAHALVWAAGVYAEEVFMDPFCGSGTILCERAYYPHKALYGCDINETAAACAKENLRMSGGNANIIASDFRKLDLPNAYVDTIVTNPPWGAQIKVDDLNALYKDFLRCAQAWLKPGGRMVILVPPIDAITRALDTNVFSCQKIYTVSLHGTLAQVLNLQLR